jgi:hypothetical protein
LFWVERHLQGACTTESSKLAVALSSLQVRVFFVSDLGFARTMHRTQPFFFSPFGGTLLASRHFFLSRAQGRRYLKKICLRMPVFLP